ncbi:hypothetical protein G6L24_07020 [Agrobacterium tumefaciens]|uniref:hypothetical protein n=1 Tax=Agrobacterium tumefaciens TaxID=358 RepID=UPI002FDAC398|nr:hypothetical protein [Agrobacterium tumefaciens]
MNYFARINALANRLERLAPSHRDQFRFHEDKSEIIAELRRLAKGMRKIAHTPANDNIRGFAPGHYMCNCNNCGKRFTGAKHSWRCEECEPQPLPERK